MNHYPRHVGDWITATAHLSEVEECIYSRMLDQYYARESPLPVEIDAVSRLVRASTTIARRAVKTILAEFFRLEADGWHQTRCDEEISAYRDKSNKAKASAALSVAARSAARGQTGSQIRSDRMRDARQIGRHTSEEWAALLVACESKCVRCGETSGIERDHIIPIYQGGSDGIENIQPLCRSCNSSKGPETIDHRPLNVRLEFGERTLERTFNGRSTNQNQNQNQRSRTVENPQSAGEAQIGESGKPLGDRSPGTAKAKTNGAGWWKTPQGVAEHGKAKGIPAKPGETFPEYKQRLFAAEYPGQPEP